MGRIGHSQQIVDRGKVYPAVVVEAAIVVVELFCRDIVAQRAYTV